MSYTPKRCSFCGKPIALGNGIMYVRNDATTFWFCSAKCRKNSLVLKRDPRKLKWSRAGARAVRSMPTQKAAPVAAQPVPTKSR